MDNKIYIGSTCGPLCKRRASHKTTARRKPNIHIYSHLNEIGWNFVKIILIESFPCNNRDELIKREQYWIDQLHPALNLRPACTLSENLSEHYRKYRDTQKNWARERIICECGRSISKSALSIHRKTKIHNKLLDAINT